MAVRKLSGISGSSALVVSLAMAAGGSVLAGHGCAEPVIIDQQSDGGINNNSDGSTTSPTGARYSANVDPGATLYSEGPAQPVWLG